jgi:hypothetical protein
LAGKGELGHCAVPGDYEFEQSAEMDIRLEMDRMKE